MEEFNKVSKLNNHFLVKYFHINNKIIKNVS